MLQSSRIAGKTKVGISLVLIEANVFGLLRVCSRLVSVTTVGAGTRSNAKVDNSDDTTFDRSTAPHFCAPLRCVASEAQTQPRYEWQQG